MPSPIPKKIAVTPAIATSRWNTEDYNKLPLSLNATVSGAACLVQKAMTPHRHRQPVV